MSNKVKWYSVNLQKEITGEIIEERKNTLVIKLENGNVIQKKPKQVEKV